MDADFTLLLSMRVGDRSDCLAAMHRVPDSADARFALRDLLAGHADALVRASAARRLGWIGCADAAPWLREAAQRDVRPSVREAAFVALARIGDEGSLALTRAAALEEPVWWVRRAALLAAARIGGTDAVDVLRRALDDPFWRVRNTAVGALVALGDADPDARARWVDGGDTASPAALGARAFLASEWSLPVPPTPLASAPPTRRPDAPFWDADPAVITARLGALPADAAPVSVLVELLAEPHASLREVAVRRLVERADAPALLDALRWVAEPRLPYAADAARAVFAALPPARVRPLVERALAPDAPAALFAWGADQAVAQAWADLAPALTARLADHDRRTRIAALRALVALDAGAEAALQRALADSDADVREAAVLGLIPRATTAALVPRRREGDGVLREPPSPLPRALPPSLELGGRARDAGSLALTLRASEPCPQAPSLGVGRAAAGKGAHDDHVPLATSAALRGLRREQQTVVARRALVAFAAGEGDAAALREALGDGDGPCRAGAIGALAREGALTADERRAAASDPDPAVRAVALDLAGACDAIADDADPLVRRAAAQRLAAQRDVLSPEQRARAASAAMASPDAWVRARAAALVGADDGLVALLTLSRDEDLAVRSAAHDALRVSRDLAPSLRELLARRDLPGGARAAAWTYLFDGLAPTNRATAIGDALADPHEPPEAREVLRALALVEGLRDADDDDLGAVITAPATRERRVGERRTLGRTGLAVSPLGVSGAYEPPRAAIEAALDAGVNTFFWEPGHVNLTKFLREERGARDGAVVVAGTFHADAPSIERDLATALRRLRTDRVDVFLLFWARSEARLSREAFATMERLKRSGRVRAVGFSTHHRELALAAVERDPWDVVMTRHSAAHPGAERALLPRAAALGVGVIAFSALCYGKLLRPTRERPDEAPPTASDCYRYALSAPAVATCLTAPRSARELAENLDVLTRSRLDVEAVARLRAHGERVHANNTQFNTYVRRARMTAPAVEAKARVLALLDDAEAESFHEARP